MSALHTEPMEVETLIKVQMVDPKFVHQVWPRILPYLERACAYTDDFTIDQARSFVASGVWTMLVAVEQDANDIVGVATLSFADGANDRTAVITLAGGLGIVSHAVFSQVLEAAKVLGATRVQVYARDSVMRLYTRVGLKKKDNLMEIRL